MSKQPIFVEVYAWNETILALIGLGWSIFLIAFQFEPGIVGRRVVLAAMVSSGALALLAIQNHWLRTLLDFRIPVWIAKRLPKLWALRLIKLWPASALVRVLVHFMFALWWILMGVVVCLNINQIEDIRLVFYFGIAAFHFDRLMRLLFSLRTQ